MNRRLDNLRIVRAKASQLHEVQDLLERSGLPQEGVQEHFRTALIARSGEKILACAVLELYDIVALLRSVAVDARWRGLGLGKEITHAALKLAQQRHVKTVFLLTETASEFFTHFGFRPIQRSEVSSPVKQSLEFKRLCPDSATVMVKEIDS